MDALEDTLAANRAATAAESSATHELLKTLINALGEPSNGPAHPATGVYWALDQMGKRVAPFELRFEQFKGGVKAITFAAVPMGVLIWFLAGDKITRLLHG